MSDDSEIIVRITKADLAGGDIADVSNNSSGDVTVGSVNDSTGGTDIKFVLGPYFKKANIQFDPVSPICVMPFASTGKCIVAPGSSPVSNFPTGWSATPPTLNRVTLHVPQLTNTSDYKYTLFLRNSKGKVIPIDPHILCCGGVSSEGMFVRLIHSLDIVFVVALLGIVAGAFGYRMFGRSQ